MRVFVFFLALTLCSTLSIAQNCSPEYLEKDLKRMNDGEFHKPHALLHKLQDLMKELKLLSKSSVADPSQKKSLSFCRDKKDSMFESLSNFVDKNDNTLT